MVTRRISTVLEGTSTSLVRAYEEAGRAADRNADRIAAFGKRVDDNERHYRNAGLALAAFGAATTTALTTSAAAAVTWESDFAGVMKTVDDSAEGYARLEDELRGMARTLPATHTEIAGVAEAAGQLGVAREDIESFTRTMIDLGETTNLTADEAATAIAQMANVMQTAPEDIERLGSTLVDLGNNGASTERQIILMSQRIAGAAAVVGMAESDVLGIANAVASMGIEVEAGGTSVSRVLTDMSKAVSQGGEDLTLFADVAGVSAAEFARAFREDPAEAFAAFITGLGDIQAAGGDVFTVLDDLSLSDVRVSQALLGMASSGDLLTDSLAMGAQAWEDNTALAEEAAKRYDTTAAKLDILRNNVRDAGISIGEVFLPALAGLAETGADVAGWLADLPEPLQQIAAWGGAAAGGTSLLAGAMLLMLPQALETYRALRSLGVIGPRAARGIKAVTGVLAGPWGLAIGAAVTALGFFAAGQMEARARARELRDTLDDQTGAITENTRAWWANDLDERGLLAQYEEMGGNVRDLTAAIEGDAEARARVTSVVEEYAAANERAASSTGGLGVNLSDTTTKSGIFMAQLDELAALTDEQGEKQRRLAEANGEVVRSQEALRAESDRLTGQAEAYAAQQGNVNDSLTTFVSRSAEARAAGDDSVEALQEWAEEMAGIDGSFISFSDALSATQTKAQEWAQSQADATDSAEDSWEDFYDGQTVNVDEWLTQLEEMVAAQQDWETNMLLLSGRVSQGVLDELARLGPEGAPLVAELVNASDEELARLEAVYGQRASGATGAYAQALYDAAPVIKAAAAVLGQDAADEIAGQIAEGETTVAEVVDKYDLEAWVNLDADPTNYESTLGLVLGMTDDSEGTVSIDADDALAQGVRLGLVDDIDSSEGTVDLDGNPTKAKNVQADLLRSIDDSEGTVSIDGNPTKVDQERRNATSRINEAEGTIDIDGRTALALQAARNAVWAISRMTAVINVTGRYAGGLNVGGSNKLYSSARASGGIERRPMMMGPGYGPTNVILAGEPETRGEAFISNHPAYRAENVRYLKTAASWFGMDVVKAYAAGHASAPRFTTPPPLHLSQPAASSGPVTAVLAPEHAALLAAAVEQDIVLKVDSREVAHATRRGEQSFGAPGRWSGAPRMGRSRS